MRKFWVLLIFAVSACMFENDNNDVEFALEYKALDSVAQNTPLDSALNIVYSSKDSMQCEFIASVACGQNDYTFKSILANDSTLKLVYVNHSHRVCGGAFRTKVILSAWSKEQDLHTITQIDFAGYLLRKNKLKP